MPYFCTYKGTTHLIQQKIAVNIAMLSKSQLWVRALLLALLCFGVSFAVKSQRPSLNQFQSRSGGVSASQNAQTTRRPATIRRDTVVSVVPDSLRSTDNQLETTVDYSARDSTVLDVAQETVYLYGDAVVNYGDIELKAAFIKLSWGEGEVFAHGLPDTTKQVGEPVTGKPIFSQGGESYNTDTIRYNFESKRAIIKGIVTQQGEGIVQGKKVKKDSLDNLYLVDAMYTTCNLKEPHFHISADKIKLVNKKNVISGPFNLVIADIPLPIGLPFGFFPVPKDKEIGTSGFIMGQYGEEPRNRGFYFRDFGYYQAINKNIGIKVLGQIYSRGSWGAGLQSTYTKRYSYGGNLNLQFNRNKSGDVLESDQTSRDFSVAWSHAPQSRRSDRSFSASVNLRSNGFDQRNRDPQEVQLYTANTSNSSVQFTRNFGNLLRTSAGVSANQNFSTKVLNFNASYNVGLNQFNPFVKEENQIGRWFEQFRVGLDIQGGYQTSNNISGLTRSTSYTDYQVYGVSNQPLTDAELREQALGFQSNLNVIELNSLQNLQRVIDLGQFRTTYSVPISLPNFKLARYINVTPSINYRGEIFTQKLNYEFYEKDTTFVNASGETVRLTGIDPKYGAIRIDTSKGFYNAYNVSAGLSMNTRVYGTYQFKGKSRLQAIRHTVAPSVSINYTPDLKEQFFERTKVRNDDPIERWLPFFPQLGSTPGASGRLGFNLTNQLEAKLRARSDTAESQFEKISLLDNFGFSGGYNLLGALLGDTLNLSNINFGANTQILKDLVSLNVNATLDPYAYIEDVGSSFNRAGRRVSTFKWKNPGFDGNYFSTLQVSVSTRLSPATFKKKETKTASSIKEDPAARAMREFVATNPQAYVDFSIPWSMNVSFNYGYNRQGLAEPQTVAALQLTGDFSLTQKWKFNFSTGYDFRFKATTLTTLGVIRDLHCWDMSFNWTPIAGNNLRASNYSFNLNVRSALLRDLKISRRRVFYDVGGF